MLVFAFVGKFKKVGDLLLTAGNLTLDELARLRMKSKEKKEGELR